MKGLKRGTIFTLQQMYFVVTATDEKGSFIEQTGARSVKEYKEMQQKGKEQAVKKIKTKKKLEGADNGQ